MFLVSEHSYYPEPTYGPMHFNSHKLQTLIIGTGKFFALFPFRYFPYYDVVNPLFGLVYDDDPKAESQKSLG